MFDICLSISEVKDCQSHGIVAVLLPEVATLTQIAQQVCYYTLVDFYILKLIVRRLYNS